MEIGYAKVSSATNSMNGTNFAILASSHEPPIKRRFERLPTYHKKAPRMRCFFVVGRGGFEPPKSKTSDLQSDPFGHSGICPYKLLNCGAGDWTRTHNLLITNQLLCQLSYTGIFGVLNRFASVRQVPLFNQSLAHFGATVWLVPWGGIEPPTGRFSVCCSTD